MTETVVEEYPHSCRIVREAKPGEAYQPLYHFEGPLERQKTFESLSRAKLYADVQTVTGGFREEKTGERGVPPAVARAREDVLIAYHVATPTQGVTWTARAFDLEEDEVRLYVDMVRDRAETQRGSQEQSDE
jgi:hypothetical protein